MDYNLRRDKEILLENDFELVEGVYKINKRLYPIIDDWTVIYVSEQVIPVLNTNLFMHHRNGLYLPLQAPVEGENTPTYNDDLPVELGQVPLVAMYLQTFKKYQ